MVYRASFLFSTLFIGGFMQYPGIDLHTNRFACCYLSDDPREKRIVSFDIDGAYTVKQAARKLGDHPFIPIAQPFSGGNRKLQRWYEAAQIFKKAGLRNCSGKPGWSYFCIRAADTKILLARGAPGIAAEIPQAPQGAEELQRKARFLARSAKKAHIFFLTC
jgi:hypothetical protein